MVVYYPLLPLLLTLFKRLINPLVIQNLYKNHVAVIGLRRQRMMRAVTYASPLTFYSGFDDKK